MDNYIIIVIRNSWWWDFNIKVLWWNEKKKSFSCVDFSELQYNNDNNNSDRQTNGSTVNKSYTLTTFRSIISPSFAPPGAQWVRHIS